jgi:hypothetical protein
MLLARYDPVLFEQVGCSRFSPHHAAGEALIG